MLDLGTGTGVLPRNMYSFGAKWTGTDISPEQIEQAKKLSQSMGIGYYAMPAEKIDFPDASLMPRPPASASGISTTKSSSPSSVVC